MGTLRVDMTLEETIRYGTEHAAEITKRLIEQIEANTRLQSSLFKGVSTMPCGKKSKPKGSKVKTKR